MGARASFSPLLAALCLIAGAASQAWAADAVQRTISPIDWKAAEQARAATPQAEAAIRQLRASSPIGLDQVKLPVLILPAEGEWGAPRFHGQGTAYAALYAPPRAKLGIFGASSRIVAPAGLKIEHATGAFESIGDGADYSFTRFGAAYTLRITCDEPLKDTRCTDPRYLTEAANALLVAGGAAR